jgi:hypothetical protein
MYGRLPEWIRQCLARELGSLKSWFNGVSLELIIVRIAREDRNTFWWGIVFNAPYCIFRTCEASLLCKHEHKQSKLTVE